MIAPRTINILEQARCSDSSYYGAGPLTISIISAILEFSNKFTIFDDIFCKISQRDFFQEDLEKIIKNEGSINLEALRKTANRLSLHKKKNKVAKILHVLNTHFSQENKKWDYLIKVARKLSKDLLAEIRSDALTHDLLEEYFEMNISISNVPYQLSEMKFESLNKECDLFFAIDCSTKDFLDSALSVYVEHLENELEKIIQIHSKFLNFEPDIVLLVSTRNLVLEYSLDEISNLETRHSMLHPFNFLEIVISSRIQKSCRALPSKVVTRLITEFLDIFENIAQERHTKAFSEIYTPVFDRYTSSIINMIKSDTTPDGFTEESLSNAWDSFPLNLVRDYLDACIFDLDSTEKGFLQEKIASFNEVLENIYERRFQKSEILMDLIIDNAKAMFNNTFKKTESEFLEYSSQKLTDSFNYINQHDRGLPLIEYCHAINVLLSEISTSVIDGDGQKTIEDIDYALLALLQKTFGLATYIPIFSQALEYCTKEEFLQNKFFLDAMIVDIRTIKILISVLSSSAYSIRKLDSNTLIILSKLRQVIETTYNSIQNIANFFIEAGVQKQEFKDSFFDLRKSFDSIINALNKFLEEKCSFDERNTIESSIHTKFSNLDSEMIQQTHQAYFLSLMCSVYAIKIIFIDSKVKSIPIDLDFYLEIFPYYNLSKLNFTTGLVHHNLIAYHAPKNLGIFTKRILRFPFCAWEPYLTNENRIQIKYSGLGEYNQEGYKLTRSVNISIQDRIQQVPLIYDKLGFSGFKCPMRAGIPNNSFYEETECHGTSQSNVSIDASKHKPLDEMILCSESSVKNENGRNNCHNSSQRSLLSSYSSSETLTIDECKPLNSCEVSNELETAQQHCDSQFMPSDILRNESDEKSSLSTNTLSDFDFDSIILIESAEESGLHSGNVEYSSSTKNSYNNLDLDTISSSQNWTNNFLDTDGVDTTQITQSTQSEEAEPHLSASKSPNETPSRCNSKNFGEKNNLNVDLELEGESLLSNTLKDEIKDAQSSNHGDNNESTPSNLLQTSVIYTRNLKETKNTENTEKNATDEHSTQVVTSLSENSVDSKSNEACKSTDNYGHEQTLCRSEDTSSANQQVIIEFIVVLTKIFVGLILLIAALWWFIYPKHNG